MDAETFILTALSIAERTPDAPEVRQAALTELLNEANLVQEESPKPEEPKLKPSPFQNRKSLKTPLAGNSRRRV